jgi:hypothetical protein
MTAVQFIRDHDRYMRGEVAGFRPAEAERLVHRKIARLHKRAVEESSTATPAEVSSPATAEVPGSDQTDGEVDIPEGWRSLSWPARKSLASRLTDAPIVNGEDAEQAILAELARRGR